MTRTLRIWTYLCLGLLCVLLLLSGVFVFAQNTPGLSLGGTGTSSTQSQGALPVVASGGNSLTFSSVGTSGYFVRSGGTGVPTFLDLFGTANTWSASQALNGGVTSTGTVNLTSGTLRTPNSTALPGSCTAGDQYFDTDATSAQRFYVCDSANTWKAVAGSNAQLLWQDDLFNGSSGSAWSFGGTGTKYGIFGARYNQTLNYTEGPRYPAGTFSDFSAIVTPGNASCNVVATLEKDTGSGYSACITGSTLSGTSRVGTTYSSSTCSTNAGDKIRVNWTATGSGCTVVSPISQVLFKAS